MNAQAYEGYFKDGRLYAAGQTIDIPEGSRVHITIYEPTSDKASLKEALQEAQEQAVINGTSEMTMGVIDDIIAECRREMRGEK